MPQPKESKSQSSFKGAEVGINLLTSLFIAAGLGYGLDVWLETTPLFLLMGFALGFASWLRTIYKLITST